MKYTLAIVHDYLTHVGGAEMVLKSMGKIWAEAPIYTLIHDKKTIGANFINNPIKESFLKKAPSFLKKRRKLILPLLAVAPETFDLREFDVALSSSGAFSKGIITKPNTVSICYCHSPMRFAWDYTHQYLRELSLNKPKKLLARLVLNYIRLWDVVSADRVDYFIANSRATQEKIKKYYRRESTVIYPPVETDLFRPKNNSATFSKGSKKQNRDKGYYLIVSRLSAYKKIDVAVEAFNKLGWKLVVIGEGPEYKNLKKIAGATVKILGSKSRKEVINYFQGCRGYILPAEEDFGISAVEAMATGKPVLALRAGGALETVVEGVTGEFFDATTVEVLAEGAYRIEQARKNYNSQEIIKQAQKFSRHNFETKIKQFIEEKYEEFKNKS